MFICIKVHYTFEVKYRKHLALLLITTGFLLFFQRKIEVDVATAKASDLVGASTWVRSVRSPLVSDMTSKQFDNAKSGKVSAVSESEKNTFDPEEKDLLCKLKAARTNIPLQGDVQVVVNKMTPFFGTKAENVAWVKSDSCPEEMYSIVHFSDDGSVAREIDCRNATLTEIAALSGEQGNIKDAPHKKGETNLAVVGNGYFVLSCPGGQWFLTRDGTFQQENGHLVDKNGCMLLSQQGRPFQNFEINEDGCSSQGECVATVDPAGDDVSGLDYVNNYSFLVEDIGQLAQSITKTGSKMLRPNFYVDALEDIHNPERGATSVSWGYRPRVNLSEIDCR